MGQCHNAAANGDICLILCFCLCFDCTNTANKEYKGRANKMDQTAWGRLKVKLVVLNCSFTLLHFCIYASLPPLWLFPLLPLLVFIPISFSLEALKGLIPAATAQMADRRQAVYCNGGFVLCVGLKVCGWGRKRKEWRSELKAAVKICFN